MARARGRRGTRAFRAARRAPAATAALGRLSGRAEDHRILAGPRIAAARSAPLPPRGRVLADRAPRAVTLPGERRSHTLLALIGLGILNHTVLAGSRVAV